VDPGSEGASLWIAVAAVLAGGILTYEAAYPWVIGWQPETPWHAPLDRATAEPAIVQIQSWCDEAKCPRPDALETSWEPNAGIDLQAVLQGRLRLRIGMPLWLGLETRMLRAVVMHELGHFRQRHQLQAVLRHQELGRRIALGALGDWGGGHVFWRFSAWLWPQVQRLAKPWLHQLETEADAYAGHMAGPEWVAATMLRLKALEQATAQTFRTVQSSMTAGVLPKNLVTLYRQETSALVQPLTASTQRRALKGEESPTHPALGQRIAVSERERVQALEFSREAAWMPEKTHAKAMTEAFYAHELGSAQAHLKRVSVNDARCHLTRSQDAHSALDHYFMGLVLEAAPVRPLPAPAGGRDGLGALNATSRLPLLRKTLQQNRAEWLKKKTQWEEAHVACRQIASGESHEGCSGDVQKALQDRLMRREAAAAVLRNATEQFSQRLTFGLWLLESPEVAGQWPEARLWMKVATALREELPLAARLLGLIEEASFDVARLGGLEAMASGRRRVCEVEARRQIWQSLSKAVAALDRRNFADTSLREHLLETFERMGSMSAEAVVERMETLYRRLSQLYLQGLGDLAYAAGKAELAAGLKPWE
jgi:Peptidase family M48